MKHIITIQHTQSVHHTNGMVGSWTDWDLSDLGRQQAENIGRNLADYVGDSKFVLYSSDLKRAKQTAEAVGKSVAVDKTVETQTITVQANAFSEYTVAGGIFGECTDENCFYINEYAAMTTLEKYAYLMGDLYTVDDTALEAFMLHIAFFHCCLHSRNCVFI